MRFDHQTEHSIEEENNIFEDRSTFKFAARVLSSDINTNTERGGTFFLNTDNLFNNSNNQLHLDIQVLSNSFSIATEKEDNLITKMNTNSANTNLTSEAREISSARGGALDSSAESNSTGEQRLHLWSVIVELGYEVTTSVNICRNVLVNLISLKGESSTSSIVTPTSSSSNMISLEEELNATSIAKTIALMIRTHHCMTDSLNTISSSLGLLQPLKDAVHDAALSLEGGVSNNDSGKELTQNNSSSSKTWNVEVLVKAVNDLRPTLHWKEIIYEMDHEGFCVIDRTSLLMFITAVQMGLQVQGFQSPFPVDLFYRQWKNSEGKLSLFTQILRNPDIFNFFDHPHHSVAVQVLKVVPPTPVTRQQQQQLLENGGGKSSSISTDLDKSTASSNEIILQRHLANWRSLELIDSLLLLAESGHAESVMHLFSTPKQHCPDVLALGLIQIHPPLTHFRTELLAQMLRLFLSGGVGLTNPTTVNNVQLNSTTIFNYAWNSQTLNLKSLIICTMADWYNTRSVSDSIDLSSSTAESEVSPRNRCDVTTTTTSSSSRITRILDVAQELKALPILLNMHSTVVPFVIDLAVVAARRKYLNLEKWLTDQLHSGVQAAAANRANGNRTNTDNDTHILLINSLLAFLHAKFPILKSGGGNNSGRSPPMLKEDDVVGASLNVETVLVLFVCLQQAAHSALQRLPPNLRESITVALVAAQPLVQLHTSGEGGSSKQQQSQQSSLSSVVSGNSSVPPINNPAPSNVNVSNVTSDLHGMNINGTSNAPTPSVRVGVSIGCGSTTDNNNEYALRTSLADLNRPPMPDLNGPVSIDVEHLANTYFQRIFNQPPNPTLSVDQILDKLRIFQHSDSQSEREVFVCMLKNLFDEYKFFAEYPSEELNITAQLFGGIVEMGLSSTLHLGMTLRFVLEATKNKVGSKLFYFGVTALDRCKRKLKDYPTYCEHLVSVDNFVSFPPSLIPWIQFGCKSQHPPTHLTFTSSSNKASNVSMATNISSVEDNIYKNSSGAVITTTVTNTTTTVVLATSSTLVTSSSKTTTSSVTMSAVGSCGHVIGRPSIANATNIDTLLNAKKGEEQEQITTPADKIQDKVAFIFNNLSLSNMQSKAQDLKSCLEDAYFGWLAQYMVMKRASIEPNFHSLYSSFLSVLGKKGLFSKVIDETYANIRILLNSDKTNANFSDRSLLKNLGHWLGLMTVARNVPVLILDLQLKPLIIEAYHKGQHELLYVIPFVAKILESCAKSRVFKVPCPWTVSMMNLLGELHQQHDLKLNLKFEIEVLCKTLSLEIGQLKPGNLLIEGDKQYNELNNMLNVAGCFGSSGGMSAATAGLHMTTSVAGGLIDGGSVAPIPALHHSVIPPVVPNAHHHLLAMQSGGAPGLVDARVGSGAAALSMFDLTSSSTNATSTAALPPPHTRSSSSSWIPPPPPPLSSSTNNAALGQQDAAAAFHHQQLQFGGANNAPVTRTTASVGANPQQQLSSQFNNVIPPSSTADGGPVPHSCTTPPLPSSSSVSSASMIPMMPLDSSFASSSSSIVSSDIAAVKSSCGNSISVSSSILNPIQPSCRKFHLSQVDTFNLNSSILSNISIDPRLVQLFSAQQQAGSGVMGATTNAAAAIFNSKDVHGDLVQLVRVALERSISDWTAPVLERTVKIALTTCETLIAKDFAMDGDEIRVCKAAHATVRHLTAALSLITAYDHLALTIKNHLKTAMTALGNANNNNSSGVAKNVNSSFNELIDMTVNMISNDNVQLAIAVIQKRAMEKAVIELDKRLAVEYEKRVSVINKSSSVYRPDATFFATQSQMPEALRLNAFERGSQDHNISAVYDEFTLNLPGFKPLTAVEVQNMNSTVHLTIERYVAGALAAKHRQNVLPNDVAAENIGVKERDQHMHQSQQQQKTTVDQADMNATTAQHQVMASQQQQHTQHVLQQQESSHVQVISGSGTQPTPEFILVLDEVIVKVKAFVQNQPALPHNPHIVNLHALVDGMSRARERKDTPTIILLVQRAVDNLLEGLNVQFVQQGHIHQVDAGCLALYRDANLLLLRVMADPASYGPHFTAALLTKCLIEARDDIKYNLDAFDCFLRSGLVDLVEYDKHLTSLCSIYLNNCVSRPTSRGAGASSIVAAVTFAMHLCKVYLLDDRTHALIFESDMFNTIEVLQKIATQVVYPPDGLTNLLEMMKMSSERLAHSLAMTGPTSQLHSGIIQAREFQDPPGLLDKTEFLLHDWVSAYHSRDAGKDSRQAFVIFVQLMNQHGILKTDDLITRFFRMSTQMCVDLCYRALMDSSSANKESGVNGMVSNSSTVGVGGNYKASSALVRAKCFHTLDAYVRLITLLVKHSGETHNTITKVNLLNKVLGIVGGVLLMDHEVRKTDFQQLPYHRIFIILFLELNTPDPILDNISFQVLTAYCNMLHLLRPEKAPGFAYVWLQFISHRLFVGKMLDTTPQQKGWPIYCQLLIDLLKFLSPFLRNDEVAKPIQAMYRGTLRLLLVLLHDFPEFLCDYHYNFCDAIPPNCIQMRNLILSAFPRNMRLPDPFTPNLKVEMLTDIAIAPHTVSNFAAVIEPGFKKNLDSYLKNRCPVSVLSEVRDHLLVGSGNGGIGGVCGRDSPGESGRFKDGDGIEGSKLQSSATPTNKYNIQMVNAVVMHVGTSAIQYIRSKGLSPNMQTIAHSSHMDIFQSLAVNLESEGRYLFLTAIANQLRYPNSHTHYFSCCLLYLFGEANSEIIREQITRVLLERLIVNRPHPWGLLITFIELIQNASYDFWPHDFVTCAPEIQRLFESVARSCMVLNVPSQQQQQAASILAVSSSSSSTTSTSGGGISGGGSGVASTVRPATVTVNATSGEK